MNILGIICEYNPLHNGHLYQLQSEKVRHKADGVVCLMSGNFVQRGAPAMYDKWSRAKAAVLCGADLVLELPVVYSAQSAMRFAFGAVSLLNHLGCINHLSFGSECGDLKALLCAADVVLNPQFADLVKEKQKSGISYPTARSAALCELFPDLDESLLHAPNNTLAVEYLCALRRLNSSISPVTLKRNTEHLSASLIREKIRAGKNCSQDIPQKARDCFGTPYDAQAFDYMVSAHFRRETPETLRKICDVAEGLEYRFIRAAKETFGANDLVEQVMTKRYTKTRIQRIIVNALLGITDSDTQKPPEYARVLALNDRGAKILKKISQTSEIPVITKLADAVMVPMLQKDILATDLYALLTPNKQAGQDFTTSPIYIKEH